jgi:ATP-binding cassette, subfamily B, bacterial CvaB/MchF/RaxB
LGSGYRQAIAAVMQDDQLLSGSIAENIAFFSQTPDQNHIEASAKHAAIHDDIMRMPMQYQTLIGDMGSSLSGGQRQRVMLARALYRNPQLLFLDEATSNLDLHSERLVTEAVKQIDTTRIVIAHRPQTIEACGRKLVCFGTAVREEFEQ